jgi:hypothetical protein
MALQAIRARRLSDRVDLREAVRSNVKSGGPSSVGTRAGVPLSRFVQRRRCLDGTMQEPLEAAAFAQAIVATVAHY